MKKTEALHHDAMHEHRDRYVGGARHLLDAQAFFMGEQGGDGITFLVRTKSRARHLSRTRNDAAWSCVVPHLLKGKERRRELGARGTSRLLTRDRTTFADAGCSRVSGKTERHDAGSGGYPKIAIVPFDTSRIMGVRCATQTSATVLAMYSAGIAQSCGKKAHPRPVFPDASDAPVSVAERRAGCHCPTTRPRKTSRVYFYCTEGSGRSWLLIRCST